MILEICYPFGIKAKMISALISPQLVAKLHYGHISLIFRKIKDNIEQLSKIFNTDDEQYYERRLD
jgi:hypothetical protein